MKAHLLASIPTTPESQLKTLVENRTSIDLSHCQINVFETHNTAEKIDLVFDDLVITSMLRGKKVMHLPGKTSFDYLPGESVVVQPGEKMTIDFPNATAMDPTQCIALAISKDEINSTLNYLNERFPREKETIDWKLDQNFFHLSNNVDLADILNRMMKIGVYDQSKEKDLLADLTLRELLIRLMQTQARSIFDSQWYQLSNNNRFAHVIRFIKENITEKIDIDSLCEKACMSRPNFFRKFKETFGITPAEYVFEEKMKLAKQKLSTGEFTVSEICYMLGFQNLNHFIRAFKIKQGITPKQFQLTFQSQNLK